MKSIIFIPGIEATALTDSNSFDFNIKWNAFDTLGNSIATKLTGLYLEDALQFNPMFDELPETIIERNHIASLPYEASLNSLKTKLNAQLFLFGYDWRLSNITNGYRLYNYFKYLQAKLAASLKPDEENKFYFITHSMGALVFMNFVNHLHSGDTTNISKVVLCAPPLKGSPYALIHMLKEESGVKGFINTILSRTMDVRKVMRTYPSVYELLPTYKGAITFADTTNDVNLLEPLNWQSNIIDNKDEKTKRIFLNRLQLLKDYHQRQMKFPEILGNRTIVIAGKGDKDTCTRLQVFSDNNGTKNYVNLSDKTSNDTGDGTVPYISSTAMKDILLTISVEQESVFQQPGNVSFHGLFLRDSRVHNIIKRYFESDKLYTPDADISDLKSIGEGVNNAYLDDIQKYNL